MVQVISMGEVMVQMNPIFSGPLRQARLFERHIAGSEANTLAGLQQLGINTQLISQVGQDEFGLAITSELQAFGIDTSQIKASSSAPTGVYFVQRGYPVPNKTTVQYYRKGSAASFLSPDNIDPAIIRQSNLVHLTGITPVLSETCYQAGLKLIDTAQQNSIPVSFDTNIRVTLWKSRENALEGLKPFFSAATYLFVGQGDLLFLFGSEELIQQVHKVRSLAPRCELIIVKQGKDGATAFQAAKSHSHPGFSVNVVDELGAGDAFDAAFLACILVNKPIDTALRYANAAGALTVMAKGDLEPLPTWHDLELFLSQYGGTDSTLLR